MFKRVNFYGP